jgi:hypothetical protein
VLLLCNKTYYRRLKFQLLPYQIIKMSFRIVACDAGGAGKKEREGLYCRLLVCRTHPGHESVIGTLKKKNCFQPIVVIANQNVNKIVDGWAIRHPDGGLPGDRQAQAGMLGLVSRTGTVVTVATIKADHIRYRRTLSLEICPHLPVLTNSLRYNLKNKIDSEPI